MNQFPFAFWNTITASGPTSVVSVSPAYSHVGGGRTVFITVTDSSGCVGAKIGGTAATGFSIIDPTTVSCVVPAKAAGAYDVVVTNGFGDSTPLIGAFTYLDPTTNATLLLEHGNYNAGTQIWTETVGGGIHFEGPGFSGASPAAVAGCPDFNNDSDLVTQNVAAGHLGYYLPYAGNPKNVSGFITLTGGIGGTPDPANPWLESQIVADHGYGAWGITYTLNGAQPQIRFWYWDGTSAQKVTANITAGVKSTIHWRMTWDGATGILQIGVNGSWTAALPVSVGMDSTVASKVFDLGMGYTNSASLRLDGIVHDFSIYGVNNSDDFFSAMSAYYNM